jgi:hypothetical protein
MSTEIEAAARALAEARVRAERASADLAEAEAARARIAKRVDELTAERTAIVAGHRAGTAGPDAALRLP